MALLSGPIGVVSSFRDWGVTLLRGKGVNLPAFYT
jgi:hypothetical protein